jgi:hypothetical protein
MKRLLLSLVGAALIAVGGLTATASASTIINPVFTTTMGTKPGDVLIPGQFNGDEYSVGRKFNNHENFKDTISFSINSATNLVLKVLTWGSINWNLTLKDGATNAVIQSTGFGSGTLRGHSGTMVTELLSLNKAGNWVLTLTGTACSCAGYVIAISGAVTPIPPALVMFLTALIGLGGFGWLRRSAAGSAAAAA